jgi:hypothetical protein
LPKKENKTYKSFSVMADGRFNHSQVGKKALAAIRNGDASYPTDRKATHGYTEIYVGIRMFTAPSSTSKFLLAN